MNKENAAHRILNIKNWSLLYKLTVSYTGIFVVVLFIIVQTYYSNTVADVERETISYAGLYLEQLNENMNKYLNEFERLTAMTLADGQLQAILKEDVRLMTEEEKLENAAYVQSFLFNLYTLQPDIYNILLVDDLGRLYSEGIRRYSMEDSGLNEASWYTKATEAMGRVSIDANVAPDGYTAYLKSRRYLTVFRSVMPLGIRSSQGVIRIDVPLEKFHRIIESVNNSSRMHIVVVDDENNVLYDPHGFYDEIFNEAGKLKAELAEEEEVTFENESYIYLSDLSGYSGWKIYGFLPKAWVIQESTRSRQASLFLLVIGTFVIALVSSILSYTITRPIKHLQQAMRMVEKGDYETKIQVDTYDEVGYLGYSFNQMTEKIDQHIRTEYELSIRTRDAELKALLEEISPHFLYNTLDSIRTRALSNSDEEVADMIENLATFLRLNILAGRDLCKIDEEVTHVETYLKIYNMRHHDRFQYIMDIDERIREMVIPKLSLQPVVENALIHGFKNMTGNCLILIRAEHVEDDIRIEITDNGNGLEEDMVQRINEALSSQNALSQFKSGRNHIGLNNVNQRLKIHFGKAYGLQVESVKGKGTKVLIRLPGI